MLAVIYLVFTEGYAGTSGDTLVRRELSGEAIRLARLVSDLVPWANEIDGLLGLMLLHDARRETRTDDTGALVLLEEQDRSRWNHAQIREGLARVDAALERGPAGPYAIQAAIAALHAKAATAADTDWRQIAALYALLNQYTPSEVVELNHAVAVSMVDGPDAALLYVDAIVARGELRGYHLLHAARADLLRRLNRGADAVREYELALELVKLEPERQFLRRRLAELTELTEPRARGSAPTTARSSC